MCLLVEGTHLTPRPNSIWESGVKGHTIHLQEPSRSETWIGWFWLPWLLSEARFPWRKVPAFFYHVFSLRLPLPLLFRSLLLGIMGSRKMRELSLASSLERLVPGLGLHHLQ